MTTETADGAILKAMELINRVYAGKMILTPEVINLWGLALGEFTPATIEAATIQVLTTRMNPWPPTVADVRDACVNISMGRLAAPTAPEAWLQALPYLTTGRSDLEALPSLTRSVLSFLGGVEHLRMSTDIDRDRIAFTRAYEVLQAAARTRRLSLPAVTAVAEAHRVALLAGGKP